MCSIDPEGAAEMIKATPVNLAKTDICRKCGEQKAQVVLREKDIYCNTCFLSYFVHKFRSTIGKSKQIKPMDKILIAYSGGMNSSALLHLIRQGFDEDSHKKLRFDPFFIYIDETGIFDKGLDASVVCGEVTKLNFPCFYVRLEEVMRSNDVTVFTYLKENPPTFIKLDSVSLVSELKNLYTHISSQTTQEDLLIQLRDELICRCAKKLGIEKVFLGENGTDLSVRILSDMALGRGAQVPGHVHFKSVHFGTEIFRPMKELLNNEIDYFMEIKKIHVPNKLGKKYSENSNSSITHCTRNFVMGLQKDFPATVPTILKTGDKLVAGNLDSMGSVNSKGNSEPLSDDNREEEEEEDCKENVCLMCGSLIDTNQCAASALESIKVSKIMSTVQPPPNASLSSICGVNGEANSEVSGNEVNDCNHKDGDGELNIKATSNIRHWHDSDLYKNFCFGCSNLFREVKMLELLPARIKEELKARHEEERTLNLIKDCLL